MYPALQRGKGVLANARRGRDPKCSASENGCRLRMQCSALDLPPRRIELYSARAARQLCDSAPGKHGCADDRLVWRKQELWLYYALMATLVR